MLNEIIAFVLGFITAFILFAIIGYRQKKKLEEQIKNFDISTIQRLNSKRMGGDINEKREN